MKTRKKSGLRRAQRMYQGSAVAQNAAPATGCNSRNASRQRSVSSAQEKTAPPHRIMPGGPFASTANPRKKPKASSEAIGEPGAPDVPARLETSTTLSG